MEWNRVDGLHGGGPWKISEYCEAINHNTANAARRSAHGRTKVACVCPHALYLFEQWRKKMNGRDRRDPRKKGMALSLVKPDLVADLPPDLSAGICRAPTLAEVVDKGFNQLLTKAGIQGRELSKQLCDYCPVKKECRDWVLRDESPAGSWGGVYGGLDPWNRRGKAVVMNGGRVEMVPYVID